jgi:tetratricopeptide (TPR) repeat protein
LLKAHSIADRTASAFRILGRYLLLLFFPHPLMYNYSFNDNPIVSWGDPVALLSLALWLGLFVFAVMQFKKKTILSFGILFTIITFSLTSNIFYIIGDTMAERLLFTPLLGFAICIAWLIMRYTKGLQTSAFRVHSNSLGIAMILILPFTLKTVLRNPDWYNNDALMYNDAQKESGSARVQFNYGVIIMGRTLPTDPPTLRYDHADSAIKAYRTALSIDPNYADAWANLGVVEYRRDRFDSAVICFYNARKVRPGYDVDPNLSDALYSAGQYDSAVAVLKRVVKRKDAKPVTRTKLASSYLNLKDTLTAIAVLKEGTEADRANINNFVFLGNIYGMSRKYDESRKILEEALSIQPRNRDIVKALLLTCKLQNDMARYNQLETEYAWMKDPNQK